MRKSIFRITFSVIMTFFLIVSVSSQQKPPRFEKPGVPGVGNGSSPWTVMVYLDGDNCLESAAVDDFLKMAAAGSSAQVHIVTQFDRIDGYDTRFGDWTGTKRFYISKGLKPMSENAVMNVGEVNMADPANVVDFLCWAKTNYPAENYALLFWHHGNGKLMSKAELWQDWMLRKEQGLIFKDLCRDDTSGSDTLDIGDVRKALHSGGGAQLIGFAGSVMGMIEAAYEIRDYGEMMVGHGEVEPRGGWPFEMIINDLSANPSWTASKLGSAIVDRYYETHGSNAVQSAVDLSKMDSLVGKVRALAEKMVLSEKSGLTDVSMAADNLLTEIEHTVIGEKHILPVYFPLTAENFNPEYNGLRIKFPDAGYWENFLHTFHHSMADSWISEKRKASRQLYHTDYVDLSSFCERISRTRTQEDYYSESVIGHDFFGEGTARNFQEDDDYFTFALPFDFPFFGTVIREDTTIYISSNGYIDFDSQSSHTDHTNTSSELASNKRIAPCWADVRTDGSAQQGEDVYIISNAGLLAIRWAAETYGDQEPVNFEVILFPNGFIQFNYGGGNGDISPWDTAPTIGISKGDSSNYYLAEYNGETWLTNVNSDLFKHRPSITVNSPDGGEEWAVGTAHEITWSSIGEVADVRIEYSTNSGETWDTIDSSTGNNGFYRWIVPNSTSEYCKVRVSECSLDDGPADDSDQVFSIVSSANAGITVISPNGGEQLVVDTVYQVKWANSGEVGNVKVDYSTTGGESWTNIVESIDNTGNYNWTVPDNTSNNCRIRVSETDGNPAGISDDTFSIVSAASITVTSPNGNEEWNVGSTQSITWTGSESIGDVRIDYTTNGGETWNNIVTSTNFDGSYSWTVPNTPSQYCKVRVCKSDSETGPSDMSNGAFSINSATAIIVTSPNGGEVLEVESDYLITWESSGQVGNVKIDYSTNGGESWTNIVQSMDNNGRYTWTTPGNTSNDCKIKVSETDGNPYDISDAVFKIVSTPTITVTSPNGSESWAAGSFHNITWTYTGIIGTVMIEYSTNGGNSYTTIVATTPNTGSYGWIVPNTASQSCLVRVKALDSDGYPVDVSNSTFTITNN